MPHTPHIEKLSIYKVEEGTEGSGNSISAIRPPTNTELMTKINELVNFANSLREEKEEVGRQCSFCLFTEEDVRIDGKVGCQRVGRAHTWVEHLDTHQPQEEPLDVEFLLEQYATLSYYSQILRDRENSEGAENRRKQIIETIKSHIR